MIMATLSGYATKMVGSAGSMTFKRVAGRTIELTGVAGESVTNISLGSLSITSATTVGEFAKAVVNNNSGYDFGDQLSFIVVKQIAEQKTMKIWQILGINCKEA